MLTRAHVDAFVRDVVALTPSYLVPGIASLVAVPVLFRLLGASGYGLYALMFAISQGVPQLSTSWLEGLILRFGHRSQAAAGPRALALAAIASAGGGLVLAAIFVPAPDPAVVVATGALTLATGGYLVVIARLQSHLRFAAVSWTASVRSVVGATAAIGAAAVYGSAVSAVVGLAIGFAIGTALGLLALRAGRPGGPAHENDSPDRPGDDRLRYGLASAVFAVALFILSVGDRFVLSAVRPLAEVGVYAATYTVVDLVFRFAPSVVFASVRQRTFRAWDAGNRTRATAVFGAGFVLVSALIGWMVVGATIAAPFVTFLAIDPLLVGPIAAGIGSFIVANALVVLYSAQVRQVRVASHVVLAAVVNVALNIVLDPGIGALGAALATALSYGVYLIVNAGGLAGSLGIPRRGALILGAAAAAFLGGVIWPAFGAPAVVIAAAVLLAATPLLVGTVASLLRPEPSTAPETPS